MKYFPCLSAEGKISQEFTEGCKSIHNVYVLGIPEVFCVGGPTQNTSG